MNAHIENPHDHINLLIGGAQRYGLLPSPTSSVGPAAANAAGLMLIRQIPAGTGTDGPAKFTAQAVTVFEPVEIIKAGHAFTYTAGGGKHWKRSTAHHWVEDLIRLATEHLPGYDNADWSYQRIRAVDPLPVVGLTRDWKPDVDGIVWVGPEELAQDWTEAALIIITGYALGDVPAGLHERSGVYLCFDKSQQLPWEEISSLGPDIVITLPDGQPWLQHQLDDPVTAFRRARNTPTRARPC